MADLQPVEGELVRPSFNWRNAIQTLADLAAANFLADTIRPSQDKTRALYGGLTAAALFATAPYIKEQFNQPQTDMTTKDVAIVAATAGAGALTAYFWKPAEQSNIRVPEAPGTRPHPLIIGASALYLAASLIDPTRSEEFKTRQRAGLAGGFAAYVFGPELVEKTAETTNEGNKELRRAVAGGILGGVGGAAIRYVSR